MPRYIILCQSEVTAAALDAWRELLGAEKRFGKDETPDPIVFDPDGCLEERGAGAYRTLVHRIELAAGLADGSPVAGKIVVLVDSIRPSRMSAIAEGCTWDHLVAMLILTFPEVNWIFGVVQGKTDLRKTRDTVDGQEDSADLAGTGDIFPATEHNLLSLLAKPHREPLFDPTSLREWVKRRSTQALVRLGREIEDETAAIDEVGIPRRTQRAASIDEEPEYAFLHGYAAYRYGFLADAVTTWDLMDHLFGVQAKDCGHHGYSLLLEDMRLQFPDKPGDHHLSMLRSSFIKDKKTGRATHCPLLDNDCDTSQWRFLITTGQMGKDRDLVADNEDYLEGKTVGRGAVLYKPLGGLIDLWDKAELSKDLDQGSRPGNAGGFVWPPTFQEEALLTGHGSPGKLSLVAGTLIGRAMKLRNHADTVVEFLRGSVLCMEATELLGGKTPTLTLSGLALKHEFEVKAECAFLGAGYHFVLDRRLEELEKEVAAVTRWFHNDVRKRAKWDAMASILNRLTLVYRGAGQVEEEQECLVALRKLNRKMQRPRGWKVLNPFAWLVHGILAYGEWLLISFSHIVLMTTLWILALTAAASVVGSGDFFDPVHATSRVLSWTFGGGTETEGAVATILLSWCGVIVGLFHLGILISYLYSLIARK